MGLTHDSHGTHMGMIFESWQDSTNDKTQSILKIYIYIYLIYMSGFYVRGIVSNAGSPLNKNKLTFSIIILN